MNVQNLNTFGELIINISAPTYGLTAASLLDPFADEGDPLGGNQDVGSTQNYLHIRVQQRNGRKTLTTLQGLPKEYDPKKLLKAFKKEFACNGNLVDDEEMGQVIQLQGDQRVKIANFLVDEGIPRNTIKLHGF
ncbi:translation initiation factor SUI1 [Boletus reticuloceps]|uniref:Translation initiation factor SUI1 n=1 Tax=Boletus reticuloceps TaxID=495285 RepID=A0A8I3ABK6_9AGAM|nr:translation initiation factor SUI1 [Boletus reticuloceps]